MKLLAPIFVFILTLATHVSAAEFHVATAGDDANSGAAEKPFATISKARDAARAMPGPNTIVLAPGRYFHEHLPIVLDDRDSGLTIKGKEPSATAEVYGGVPVTGWEKWKGGIWRAPVPKGIRFFNLVVDGKPAVMAQTPNLGSGYGGGVGKINNITLVVPPAWREYDFSDAQVAGFLGGGCWFSEMREVRAEKPDDKGVLPIDGGSGMFKGIDTRYVVRGVLELLDEPGEWCLKHKEGFVYYWPKSGAPAEHVIVRTIAEKLFDVHGRSREMLVENVTLENLSLIGSDFCLNWRLFSGDKLNSVPEAMRQGMVFGENVTGLKVVGCRMLAAGHAAVFLNQDAQNCVVENCLITEAGVNGIFLNGWVVGEGPFKSPSESYVNKGHRLENNFIFDCGKYIGAAAAIEVYQSGDNLITRNEIGQMARCGIMLRGVRWGVLPKEQYGKKLTFNDYFDCIHTRNIKIIGNEVYNVCRNSEDFGAIESWGVGRDNLWELNDLHDIEPAQRWDKWAHVLFPDDSSHWTTVRSNIVHHVFGGGGTAAIMVKNIEQCVENNLVVDCKMGRLLVFAPFMEPSWNMTIRHNIFAMPGVNERYGAMNPYCLTGKPYLDVKVPADAKGIREVDYNWFVPKDPQNPNPAAEKYKIDLHSTFAPAPVKRLKPDWDITAADYEITPPEWFTPIDAAKMGLRKDFPFDKLAATRRGVGEKIQAEDYQRRHELRAEGGIGINAMAVGSWAKYANIDFGAGATKAVFQLTTAPAVTNTSRPFIRRYGDTVVEAIPFQGNKSVETMTAWEITKPFTVPGKIGPELFDEVFPPEKNITTGDWKPLLAPTTSQAGVTTATGVVDFDVASGERHANSCAYARASIYAPSGRQNATMSVSCASGVKIWLNGELIIAANKPGDYSETKKGVIKAGWNTILIKVNQDDAKWTAKEKGDGNFWFKFGTVASGCGHIISLPGLPTEERAEAVSAKGLIELRLDSPRDGKLIGTLLPGQAECEIESASGIHNLYLVFPGAQVTSVDWLKFDR